jgi:HAD superfamily hydrolase (TIGR01509 family)
MPTLRAALLDFDGLILDTESAGFEALRRVFAAHGATYTLADYLQIVGTHNFVRDPLQLLETSIGRSVDRAAFAAACREQETELHRHLVVLPGVTDLLAAARARGWKLGVVSSSSHQWVDGLLRQHGLFEHFDTIVCSGDAPRVKPEPDLYLEALRRLGVVANEAVAFEDSYNGSLAAKRAGLWCVAVPNAITRSQDFAHCDRVVGSLAGFDLASLAL